MDRHQSVIHAPVSEWAERLRLRALAPPVRHDLAGLLEHYRAHAFYRGRIATARSWAEVPPLEKRELECVPVDAAAPSKPARTSGTSGLQVTIHQTHREREFRRALLYRPQLFYDLPPSVTQVVFVDGSWCASPNMAPKEFSFGGRRYRTWFAGASADPEAVWALLIALRPELIRGIASAIVRFIEESPGSLEQIGARIIGPGGEYLAEDWRTRIEQAFGAQVLDRYGSTETGPIAWQCPRCHRYHANTDEIVLEDDPDGLIATPLSATTQPLLRYRLGDQVRFDADPPDCGVCLPTLTIEAARRDDWVIDGAGRRISPLSFQFERVPQLKAWRLHQHQDGSLELFFESPEPQATAPLLERHLAEAVPNRPCHVTEGVWRLSRPGKFKRVSSDLAPGHLII